MAQKDILDYLNMLRVTGDNDYYSIVDIHKKIGNGSSKCTANKVNKLYAFGLIEIKIKNWRRYFRGKLNDGNK